MATATGGRASASSTAVGSLVDASGYKYAEKDTKPGKIKLKKSAKSGKKKGDGIFFLPPSSSSKRDMCTGFGHVMLMEWLGN
ncbi:hypothetical protein ASPBRDRAFT_37743 [Aspergillus brasiliensis CBS 101740]|uniref:Uncharacterized protein n=1 Tax=Aspergillus brasiliensis (strain CBS 101740 / IMI 381727 / IBT 21946) TaxID=767769 RepID=A0A1L9UV41_ASPBC|nr:hypothetical protein ASPBRDRAFT_37743 [Aspergillus brasiliensis CBS 101740]